MDSRTGEPFSEGRAPRLSVVIPAWNAAASIERSVRSVLDERTISLECVVIDDGSADATSEVVERLRAEDPRVVPIRLPKNGGVSNARNVGVAAARGEWLAFHDADDRMLPGGIAALMSPTADPAIRAVIGQRVWTDGRRTWLSKRYDIPDIRTPGRTSIQARPGLLFYVSATGKAFHRSLIDGLAFAGRVLGDQPWTIRALLRAGDGIEVIGDTVFEWWRPAGDDPPAGITATARASARGSAEIARVATVAFGEVAGEADAVLDDPAARAAFKVAYFDRLVRSDLSGQVAGAARRRDPEMPALFDSIAAFLRSVPRPVVAANGPALAVMLHVPPFYWLILGRSARSAYWRMIDVLAEADPRLLRRLPMTPIIRPAFSVAAGRGRIGRGVAAAYLSLVSVPLMIVDRRRRS